MPAPSSTAVAPANGTADARRACATSAALTRRPSCSIAEMRQAASPAACGAAMLVPPLISFPVSQRGTAENATPGVTTSGLASSPPRELHQPSTSRAGGVPAWAGRVRHEKGVHDGVDPGLPLELVPDAEAQVQHQRQVALLGVARGVLHSALHRAVHGDATARAVGDLEAQELGARRHAIESRDVEQVVAGRYPSDVGAVPAVVEDDVELGYAGGLVGV